MRLSIKDLSNTLARQLFIQRLHDGLAAFESSNEKIEADLLITNLKKQAEELKVNEEVNYNELFKLIDYLNKLKCLAC